MIVEFKERVTQEVEEIMTAADLQNEKPHQERHAGFSA